jgi:hypothetical protein
MLTLKVKQNLLDLKFLVRFEAGAYQHARVTLGIALHPSVLATAGKRWVHGDSSQLVKTVPLAAASMLQLRSCYASLACQASTCITWVGCHTCACRFQKACRRCVSNRTPAVAASCVSPHLTHSILTPLPHR